MIWKLKTGWHEKVSSYNVYNWSKPSNNYTFFFYEEFKCNYKTCENLETSKFKKWSVHACAGLDFSRGGGQTSDNFACRVVGMGWG